MKIRGLSIEHSMKKSRDQKSSYLKLDKEIQELENQLNNDPDNHIFSSSQRS